QGRRAAAAARRDRAGGQGRPACDGRGVERHLRNRLSRLLVWVSTETQPAQRAGCALRRAPDEEGELGARPGHPWILRCHRPRLAGEVHRAPHRRPARRAAHPEMAERWRVGGREANPCAGGDAARGQRIAAPGNIYLHYVFDVWVQAWRKKQARGDVIVVRFADDVVLGFQSEMEAKQFQVELAERFRKFNLELHPDKTRLIEFGPFAARNRRRRGEGKPDTFDFLGFTHICAKKRSNGYFTVLRQTIRKRLQAKLSEVKLELQRRMHDP